MAPNDVRPAPSDPAQAQWPFDAASVKELTQSSSSKSDQHESPPLPYRIRRSIHTLSFLTPPQTLLLSLLLLTTLHASALYLFSQGFLLTRTTLDTINDCNPISPSGNMDPSCSLPPTHEKMILLIVDALRADFVLPVQTSPKTNPSFEPSKFHHNLVTLPSQLTTQTPTHSFLSHFIADAPTTTLQRLKGLTTGSLPTFVDAGSNFGGESIGEDNWLLQAKRMGKRIAVVGDDTWLKVFPPPGASTNGSVWEKDRVWAYDSFNVEDLDTVDNGVRDHLFPLLEEEGERKSWDIVVAHSLGLDHAGHRFGAEHSETRRKLEETEKLLEGVVERMDEDTLLAVIGDHGMTDHGDHGGDSREEVDAALWVYSKAATPLVHPSWFEYPSTSPNHPIASLFNSSLLDDQLGDRLEVDWPEKGVRTTRSVSQVDLVPTISLLLGLPIPFGNLGLVIPELFYHESSLPVAPTPEPTGDKDQPKRGFFNFGTNNNNQPTKRTHETLNPLQTLLQAHLLTSSQLSHYLTTYTRLPSGKDLLPFLPELHFTLSIAKSAYRGSYAKDVDKVSMETKALEKFWSFERKARERARGVWARFDPVLMGAGGIVWIGSILVTLRIVATANNGGMTRFVVGQAVEGIVLAGWLTAGLWFGNFFSWISEGGMNGRLLVFILAMGAVGGGLSPPWTPKAMFGTFGVGRSTGGWQVLKALIPVIAHSALFASNSFTVFEDSFILFLLSTLLVLTILKGLSAPEIRLRNRIVGFAGVAVVGVRLMALSTICREEQAPRCSASFHVPPGSKVALMLVGAALVAAWLVPSIILTALSLSASNTGIAPIYLKGGIRLFLVLSVAYWGVDWCIAGLGLDSAGIALATLAKTGIARVVQTGTILGGSLLWWYSPIPLKVQKETIRDSMGKDLRTQVKFIGFANTFGSTYILFFATVFSLIFLVNSPPAQIALTLYLIIALSLLEVFDSERDVQHLRNAVTMSSLNDLLNNDIPTAPAHTGPSFSQISIIALLSHLAFFATGHQAAFPSIQWNVAFIGFPRLVYPFSPLLVILNTLGPFILTSLLIPLFSFWALSPRLRDQPPLPLLRTLLRTAAAYSTYQTLVTLSTAFWAGYFRRHLMVWKVFAPRFMLGGITVLATDVVLLVLAVGWGGLGTIAKAKMMFGTKVVE
ncbi:hypothetical protein T439DRAFT_383821 [Meredithblackwellia eburnea MCA 4105]